MRRPASAVLAGAALAAQAQVPLPAPAATRMCVTCHGPQGISTAPDAPHLAGQPRIYLEQQLKAFRSGKRASEVMGVVAKALSDEDIAAIAQWYSSIEVEVRARR